MLPAKITRQSPPAYLFLHQLRHSGLSLKNKSLTVNQIIEWRNKTAAAWQTSKFRVIYVFITNRIINGNLHRLTEIEDLLVVYQGTLEQYLSPTLASLVRDLELDNYVQCSGCHTWHVVPDSQPFSDIATRKVFYCDDVDWDSAVAKRGCKRRFQGLLSLTIASCSMPCIDFVLACHQKSRSHEESHPVPMI